MQCRARFAVLLAAALAAVPVAALAVPAARAADAPPDLSALQAMQPASGPAVPFAAEKRVEAVRLAALGFGSRGGLARRGWEIAAMVDRHGARLDAIYRFPELMLREDGFAVLPPVVAETRRAFRLERSGMRAARAARVLRIVEPARLVSAAPGWRDWLRRSCPRRRRPLRCCSRRTPARPPGGGACSPKAGRRDAGSPRTFLRPTSTGSTAFSRGWSSGTGSAAPA